MSLAIPDIIHHQKILHQNVQSFRNEPLLILVTGEWAQQFTLDHFHRLFSENDEKIRSNRGSIPSQQQTMRYDHLRRLSAQYEQCEELTSDYRHVQYYSSLTHYDKGAGHDWAWSSTIPFLSDTVILPNVFHPSPNLARDQKLLCIYKSFNRAILKSLRDSVFVAERSRFKESSLALVRREETQEQNQTPSAVKIVH